MVVALRGRIRVTVSISTVSQLLLSCRSVVAPLPLLLLHSRFCRFCCLSAVTPDIAPAVTPAVTLLLLCCRSPVAPISLRYQSAADPLLLRCCCCHSCCCSAVAPAVAPTVAPAVAWTVHGRRLKRQNQGNCCHQ